MTGWNFADIFERIAAVAPERPAIVDGARTFCWADFDQRAGALAAELTRELPRQAKAAVYLRNCAEFLESYYAALKVSLVPVNVNYRYGADELVYLLDNADAEAVIVAAEFLPMVAQIAPRLTRVRRWIVVGEPGAALSGIVPPEAVVRYEDVVAEPVVTPGEWAQRRSGDDLMLVYTGGTTGMPKGVMWRQDDMFEGLIGASRLAFNLPPVTTIDELVEGAVDVVGPRGMSASPFMHGTGLMHQFVMLLSGGTCVVLPGERVDPRVLLHTIDDHAVTAVVIVGDAFARPLLDVLAAERADFDLGSLEVISSSGALWTEEVKRDLLRYLPAVNLFDSLASSEGFGLARSVTDADSVEETAHFIVGPYVKVLADDGSWVEPGVGGVGRVVVTGPLPLGYYKDEAKSADTFQVVDGERYSIPGDYVELLPDSTIRFLGRGNACINTGGEKVYAEEVEQAVKSHPAVLDAAVLAAPHERFGSTVCAVVQVRPGSALTKDQLAAHVKTRLADFKAPRRMVVTDAIPRTATGKLDYASLRGLL